MPFDSLPTISESQARTAARLIEAVIETLGPNGERWIRAQLSDRGGNHCVMGALSYSRRKLRTPRGDRAVYFLRRAANYHLPEGIGDWPVSGFNDIAINFAAVGAMLMLARELALCAAEGRPEPPRLLRRRRA
jgi:hypothetical protein